MGAVVVGPTTIAVFHVDAMRFRLQHGFNSSVKPCGALQVAMQRCSNQTPQLEAAQVC